MSATPTTVEQHCLSLPGAERKFPFEDSPQLVVYAVHGKWFAWADLTRPLLTLKADPDVALSLQHTHKFVTPGYHMNKRHWISIPLDGTAPAELVNSLLDDAHGLIVAKLPKSVRIALLAD